MKSNDVLSELIFLGNRVVVFNLTTNMMSTKTHPLNVDFDFDYKIKDVEREENRSLCLIDYIVKVKATVKKKVLFKIELIMEGAFRSDTLADEDFKEMVELNGLITLSHISRAYIQSVTAQSGIHPPIRLPMINVNTLIEKKAQKAAPTEK